MRGQRTTPSPPPSTRQCAELVRTPERVQQEREPLVVTLSGFVSSRTRLNGCFKLEAKEHPHIHVSSVLVNTYKMHFLSFHSFPYLSFPLAWRGVALIPLLQVTIGPGVTSGKLGTYMDAKER